VILMVIFQVVLPQFENKYQSTNKITSMRMFLTE